MAYLAAHCPSDSRPPLAGNSVATDRGFLARDMPLLDAFLHYRIVDVSSIKELSRRWYPRAYFGAPTKRGNHRALADIQESIEELRYYRDTVFVPLPGPDAEAAKVAAERHGGSITGLGPDKPRPRRIPILPGRPEPLHSSPAVRPMVGIAQLVERRLVVADVAGSSPVTHPSRSREPDPCGSGSRASGLASCDRHDSGPARHAPRVVRRVRLQHRRRAVRLLPARRLSRRRRSHAIPAAATPARRRPPSRSGCRAASTSRGHRPSGAAAWRSTTRPPPVRWPLGAG